MKATVIELVGVALIVAGVALVYVPAALVVLGTILVLGAFASDRGGSR